MYVVTDFDGELIDSSEGHLKWIEDRDLLDLPLWEGDKLFLKWIEAGRFFSGKFVYRTGRLIGHDVMFHTNPAKSLFSVKNS